MAGQSHHLLISRLLVIVAGAWLPVATMAVPPCCCFLPQMFCGSAAACCCSTDELQDSSSSSDSSDHSRRRCGCSLESMPATLPVAVAVANAAEDLPACLHFEATQRCLDGQVAYADDNREWFLELARPRTATETCVALCRFLC